mmetsp:Transcript_37588/g.89752  ORF Transcript_37588/g.89752 Transcript_37588/m.89752 type:complete len:333 (-) Transcript_37588:280-1278(-)
MYLTNFGLPGENMLIARKNAQVPVIAMCSMAVKTRTEAGPMSPVALTRPDNLAMYCTFSILPNPAPADMPASTTSAGELASFRNQPQQGKPGHMDIRGHRVSACEFTASSNDVTKRVRTTNLSDSSTMPGVRIHSRAAFPTQLAEGASKGQLGPWGIAALQVGSSDCQNSSRAVLKTPASSVEKMAPDQKKLIMNPAFTGCLVILLAKNQAGTSTTTAPKDSMRNSSPSSMLSPSAVAMCRMRPAKKNIMVQKVHAVRPIKWRNSVRDKGWGGLLGSRKKWPTLRHAKAQPVQQARRPIWEATNAPTRDTGIMKQMPKPATVTSAKGGRIHR